MITVDNIDYFPIPEFKGYFISKCGKIFSAKTNRILKQRTTYKGYKSVELHTADKRYHFFVHRLVLKTFVGESTLETRHLNSDRSDNRLENLCYGTAAQNSLDKFEQNRKFQKLNKELAIKIAQDPRPYKEIAESFGVSYGSVSDIKCGCAWAKVTDGFRFQRGVKTAADYIFEKFSDDEIKFILDKNNSRQYVSEKLNIPIWKIKKIRHYFTTH